MQTQHVINYESEKRTGTSRNRLNDIHSNWHVIKTKTRPARPQEDYYAAKMWSHVACVWVYCMSEKAEKKGEQGSVGMYLQYDSYLKTY